MRYALILVVGLMIFATGGGCKKTPTDSPVAQPELEGTFVGWGRPDGTYQNVALGFTQSDSGAWSGAITYAGLANSVIVTGVSEAEDSVWFSYVRGMVFHQMLGLVSSVDIEVVGIEPSGQPSYRLYYERGGRNLSGKWTGAMHSDYYEAATYPTIYLDQAGTIFSGDIEADYIFWHLTGDIDRGALQNDAFYFAGVSTGSYAGYSFRFDGDFVGSDSLSGHWTIWSSDFNDSGTFILERGF